MHKPLELVALTPCLVEAANQHLARHVLESGRYGVHWLPYDPLTRVHPPALNADALSTGYDQVGWERGHVVLDDSRQVVGHASLQGANFDRGLHRCELGMGLEHPYWRQGYGDKLLKAAITLARSIPTVDWLDLRVLGSNEPAVNLYRKHGFKEVSRIEDFCRIDGQPMADVVMSLRVQEASG